MNFVDGGYADSSGATTALDIIVRLHDHIAQRSDKEPWIQRAVQLHVIVLTDNETTRQLASVDGTRYPDVVAPVDALFSSRLLAAGTALQGARREFSQRDIKVHKIELDHRVF